jgi:hypothetical protein
MAFGGGDRRTMTIEAQIWPRRVWLSLPRRYKITQEKEHLMKSKLTDGDADETPRRADRYGHPCESYGGGLGAHNEQGVKPLSCDTYGHLVEYDRYDARASAWQKALPDLSQVSLK